MRTIDPKLTERIAGAIADIRAGKMVILVDDEDRENEGDLCMAAAVRHARGHQLHGDARARPHLPDADRGAGRPPRAADDAVARARAGPPLGTAFTVSIEARHGVTTGHQRGRPRPHDPRRREPRRARPRTSSRPATSSRSARASGGVLVRTGPDRGLGRPRAPRRPHARGRHLRDHERGRDDGADARPRALRARSTGSASSRIADLIQYRLFTERLVRRVSEAHDHASTRRAPSGGPSSTRRRSTTGSSSRS